MTKTFRFRSLQSRILVFFLALFAVIQTATFLVVNAANWRSVNGQIESDLHVAGQVFHRFMQERVDQLMLNARLLSGDFAFKQAYASGDRDTLQSALVNLQQHRMGADIMIIVDAVDYSVITSTFETARPNSGFDFPGLIESAEETGQPSSAFETIGGRLYSLIVVPLLAPEPVAWITVGFRVDDQLAENLKQLVQTEVSFLDRRGGGQVLASTLPRSVSSALAGRAAGESQGSGNELRWTLADERFVGLGIDLSGQIIVILQRSLRRALAPFRELYQTLLVLNLVVLALATAGSVVIARTVARPVKSLVEEAGRIERGDFHHQINIDQEDEIGRLAEAFNQMMRGLAAFHRYLPVDLVRTLIIKGIESKPETRTATILFTDIEDFTSLVEHSSPEGIVAMLNEYFSAVTLPIEKYDGVITQFQGDAILAVFNVPTNDPDHAVHAVRASLEINRIVATRSFAGVTLRNRIGINTGLVVAGSVGSKNRANYTVHGDAVNIAARLETLNKQYGTRVLASHATMELADSDIPHEQIGKIDIRGKRNTVNVYKLA